MTSMTRLRRRLDRWARYADKATPGWSDTQAPKGTRPDIPTGMARAWQRHDREQLRRNELLWQRAQMEAGDEATGAR